MSRLPDSAHGDRPWRIHELTGDFELEDVWLVPGGLAPDRFGRFVELLAETDLEESASAPVRLLFRLRWTLGSIFGWDDEETGLGTRVPSLAGRLPADLREGTAHAPDFTGAPFVPLYLTENEFAAEIANSTVHGVLHFGLVEDAESPRLQMAVLVKPNGILGDAYMAAIKPFRYLVVYPKMLEQLAGLAERASREGALAHA